MSKQSKNVSKSSTKCSIGSSNRPLMISGVILAIGIVFAVLPVFMPISELQATTISGVGIMLFIFGMVVFGILLVNHIKKK